MALHADPFGHEPVRETRKVRVGDIGGERRLVRDGIQLLGHGALVCPGCNLPVVLERQVPATSGLRCGYCSLEGEAREFVAPDVYDTVANEVYVVARVV
ncbi:MAG TPA: hypothetical protein VK920_05540 [Solirubrobacterales bacterium]|jgi:hypothetical protein|nr:hypothetical protein [Solirubrobacterales bacterium]